MLTGLEIGIVIQLKGVATGFPSQRVPTVVGNCSLYAVLIVPELYLCYRLHPKDGESNVFSLSTPGGKYPGQVPDGGGAVTPR